MEILNTIINNIDEDLSKTAKRQALDNADIQPLLSVQSPITKTTSADKETDTIDVLTDTISSDGTTINISDNLLISVVKDYVLADMLSTKQLKLTSVGPNISLNQTTNVLTGIDSTYLSGSSVTVSSNKVSADLPTTTKIGTVKIGSGLNINNGILSVGYLYNGVRTATVDDSILTSTTAPNVTTKAGVQLYSSLVGGDYILYGGLKFTGTTDSMPKQLVVGISNNSPSSNPDLSLKVTKLTATIGSDTNPIFMSNGSLTKSSANIGSATHPINMRNGVFAKCDSSGDKNRTLYVDSGIVQPSYHNYGVSHGVYLENGEIKDCRPTYTLFYIDKTSPSASLIQASSAIAVGNNVPYTIASTDSVTDTNSLVETAMNNGVTNFYFRATCDTSTVKYTNFPTMIIGVPIDKLRVGVIYTYSFSFPDKVFVNNTTGADFLYSGNVMSDDAMLALRFYTNSTKTKQYSEHYSPSYSEPYDIILNARAVFYGFSKLFSFNDADMNSLCERDLMCGSVATIKMRTGEYQSDSYCGDFNTSTPTSVSFMRGSDIDGIPAIYLMGVGRNNS